MEDPRFRPEEEDNQDATVTPKKRRGSDFLSQYLLRRRENLDPSSESDLESEDNEEAEDKPKKWRRLFRGAFKSVVAPPEEPRTEREHGFDPNTWFSWQSSLNTETSEAEEATSLDEIPESSPVEKIQETPVSKTVPNTTLDHSPEETQAFRPQQTEGLIHERQQNIDPVTIEREVVIERGVGAGLPLLLVGAEYLARKSADKKISRKFDKEVKSIKENASQSESARDQLNAIVQQNREQLEALKRDRGMIEKKTVVKQPEQLKKSSERVSAVEKQQEVAQPRLVFESVASAAEHDVPMERVFERSHEIKDETPVVTTAASVGAIMAFQKDTQKIATLKPAQQIGKSRLSSKLDTVTMVDQYNQAIRTGFLTAVVLIIFSSIAYLMIK